MENSDDAIDIALGERIKALRGGQGLTLDELAARSQVSRAMISRIERAESSATAQLLNRLASGLGVSLSALFAPSAAGASPLARRHEQPIWRDPASGYRRRAVSPASAAGLLDLAEIELPPGALLAFDGYDRAGFQQLVFLQEGALTLSVGESQHALNAGDCLHMQLDRPITFHNPADMAARYIVILAPATARMAS